MVSPTKQAFACLSGENRRSCLWSDYRLGMIFILFLSVQRTSDALDPVCYLHRIDQEAAGTWQQVGKNEVVKLLEETLNEEKACDQEFNTIAKSMANQKAVHAHA
jgi:hypothetical protein